MGTKNSGKPMEYRSDEGKGSLKSFWNKNVNKETLGSGSGVDTGCAPKFGLNPGRGTSDGNMDR